MLFEMTLKKSLLFFLFDFKQFSLKTNNNEGLKKFSNFEKHECAVLTFCVATFVKARFFVFVLPDWQKAKNEQKNRRTSSTSFLLGFSFSLQNGFVHKKKQFVCWKLCFLRIQRKKDFLICSRNNFWVACFKNKSNCWTSVVLRRVLKKRQRWSKHFVWLCFAVHEVFFEVVFFLCFIEKFISRSKTFENQTCKKALFFMPS